MGKNLKINCATCDVRNVQEDFLAAYDSIKINCADILATPESQKLMSRYNVKMNCADMLVVGNDVKVKTINGKARIGPGHPGQRYGALSPEHGGYAGYDGGQRQGGVLSR